MAGGFCGIPSAGPGSNTGHGHVWDRPDGVKARCGGIGLCMICQDDQGRWGIGKAKIASVPQVAVLKPPVVTNPYRDLQQMHDDILALVNARAGTCSLAETLGVLRLVENSLLWANA